VKVWVIVTAAGSSRRMGGINKLMLPLHGQPVLAHCLQYFQNHPRVNGILLTANEQQMESYRALCQRYSISKLHSLVSGGAERQDSIRNALERLAEEADGAVAIHDGARPLMSADLLDRLLEGLEQAEGTLPMVAVKDTIKRVSSSGAVQETLNRGELFGAQTPQVFALATILEAHRRAQQEGFLGTDDCSLVERYGGRIQMVAGDYRNLKVTTEEDLEIMQRWLEAARG
jgi:2-C-methyl-D-erythritol 4-phosphate cytidylyltransferase